MDIEPVLLEELDGVYELSGMVHDDGEDGFIEDEDDEGDDGLIVDGEVVVDVLSVVDGVAGPVVVDVVELVSVVGAAGGAVLLQAPSAATVAAIATHLIELRIFTPRVVDEIPRVRAGPSSQRR